MFNIKVAPRRMLTPREAADYCGIATKKLPVTGIMPTSMPFGETRYDIKDLDAWLDGLKNNALDSDDDIIGKLGQCHT